MNPGMEHGRAAGRGWDVPTHWRGDALADHAPPMRVSEYLMDEEPEDEGFNVLHYWNLVVKYRWLLLASLVAGLAIGVVVTLLTKPIYRACKSRQFEAV